VLDESSPRYQGWRVVAACFLTAIFCWGFGLYGHGVYLTELVRLRSWPASLMSGASTASFLFSAVLAVFTKDLFDRLGPRRLTLLSTAALAAATSVIALATAPWQLVVGYLLMGCCWAGMGVTAISMTVGQWFERRRGLATSLALNGASCGGIIVGPALVFLVGAIGFTAAMFAMTAAMLLVLLPTVILFVETPASAPPRGDTELHAHRESVTWTRGLALRRFAFWSIAAPFALALLAQIGFIVHQIAILEPATGRARAASAVAVMTVMAVIGRLGLGLVVDRLDPRVATAGCVTSQAAALLVIMQTAEPATLIAASAVYGLSVGNVITLPTLIVHREFAPATFGMIVGLSTAFATLVGALGPGLMGLARQLTGGYTAALAIAVGLKLAAAVVVLMGRKLQFKYR
jgi:MFS family permease